MKLSTAPITPEQSRVNGEAPVLPASSHAGVLVVRLYGYDLDDTPLVTGLPGLGGELVRAQSTVALARRDVGAAAVVLLEAGDVRRPIVVGLLHAAPLQEEPAHTVPSSAYAGVDDERVVLQANREIVLRCGNASITLTRAGKVIIQGSYVVSRSSGYNKIKGAAVDIN